MAADRAAFRYAGVTIRVEAPEAHLRWLEEFLTPAFTALDWGGDDAPLVRAEQSDRYARVLGGSSRTGEEVDCFALDGRWIRLPRLRTRDEGDFFFDEGAGILYGTTNDGCRIDVLSTPGNRDVRIALMRVVRELAMSHARRGGGVFVHAAAFADADLGVLIAGPKGAGKTSLLMHALLGGAGRFIANDRVLLSSGNGHTTLRGMPTVVAVRRDALERFPSLPERLVRAAFDFRATLDEAAPRPWHPAAVTPVSVTPAQFCRLLETRAVADARLGAIVFPRVVAGGGIEVRALASADAAARLEAALFRSSTGQAQGCVFRAPLDRSSPEIDAVARCRQLATDVPCFECLLGPAADGEAGAAVVRSIGRLASSVNARARAR